MGRKGGKGIKAKKRTSFLARMGVDSTSTSEPAQADQARVDGEMVLRQNILARMNGKGPGYEVSYKNMAVCLREDAGPVKAEMDALVSDGTLYRKKGKYSVQ